MASSEHIQLSDYIKFVHHNLRIDSNTLGSEEAWRKHCINVEQLKQYAETMKNLAKKYWSQNSDKKAVSRIWWSSELCLGYFQGGGLLNYRHKEYDIAKKMNMDLNQEYEMKNYENKIKLLDVGSCYNPFEEFDHFEVLAIDIAPAITSVYKCDFLNVAIGSFTKLNAEEVQCIKAKSFQVVVFSLLLEYLPSPEFRLRCCERAYELLQYEGMLILITPDSNHVGANAKLMKSWRYILAKLGFSRIRYEKLTHLHCMAFRKSLSADTSKRWVNIYKKQDLYDKLYIPQDFNKISEPKQVIQCDNENTTAENELLFNELPNFVEINF